MHAELARQFCGWAGGTLSTIGEWRYAAGAAKTRIDSSTWPWGSEQPTCEQSPYVCADGTIETFSVGHHPAGASWCGMEDILLSRLELADAEPAATNEPRLLPANAPRGVYQSYRARGEIGNIFVLTDDRTGPWSFRCTWRGP